MNIVVFSIKYIVHIIHIQKRKKVLLFSFFSKNCDAFEHQHNVVFFLYFEIT